MKLGYYISSFRRIFAQGGLPLIFKKFWFYNYKSVRYCFEIPYDIYYNSGVHFAHSGRGTVINHLSKIGEGTYIQHYVTLGVRDDKNESKAPVVGKNCYIGARAILIGDITIGDNCKIGAGAVVVKDVPSDSTVVGVPAKVIAINKVV